MYIIRFKQKVKTAQMVLNKKIIFSGEGGVSVKMKNLLEVFKKKISKNPQNFQYKLKFKKCFLFGILCRFGTVTSSLPSLLSLILIVTKPQVYTFL